MTGNPSNESGHHDPSLDKAPRRGEPRPRPWHRGRATRIVTGLVLVAIGLAALVFFIADNFVLVDVRLFTFQRQMRLAWALLIAFAVGALLGAVAVKRR